MGQKKARILVACVRPAYTRLFAILSGYELVFAGTLTDAHSMLKAGSFDLIMIGLYFDESRMFDLLRFVRADNRYDRVPVLCLRGVIGQDAEVKVGLEGVEAACKTMGATTFFDLPSWPDDAIGNAAIRHLIDEALAAA